MYITEEDLQETPDSLDKLFCRLVCFLGLPERLIFLARKFILSIISKILAVSMDMELRMQAICFSCELLLLIKPKKRSHSNGHGCISLQMDASGCARTVSDTWAVQLPVWCAGARSLSFSDCLLVSCWLFFVVVCWLFVVCCLKNNGKKSRW